MSPILLDYAMEHRHYYRFDLSQPTTLLKNNLSLGNYCLTNIGYGGAFVTGQQLDINRGDMVYLYIEINHAEKKLKYQISTIVVYVSADGVGLTWIEPDVDIYQIIEYTVSNAA